jgi:hypothetical protein
MKTLAGFVYLGGQAFEADRDIHEIAQYRLARDSVAREKGIDRLREKRFSKARIALGASQDGFVKISCEWHIALLRPVPLCKFGGLV